MIRGPPEAPTTNLTFFCPSTMIEGLMDEVGLLFGLMKFSWEAGMPYKLVVFGVEKSSISLLNTMRVDLDMVPGESKGN